LYIEVQIGISFGLDIFITFCSCVSTIMEVIMKNLNAITLASETVIYNICISMPNQALWEVEQYWRGYQ